jgi:hypothetical protein
VCNWQLLAGRAAELLLPIIGMGHRARCCVWWAWYAPQTPPELRPVQKQRHSNYLWSIVPPRYIIRSSTGINTSNFPESISHLIKIRLERNKLLHTKTVVHAASDNLALAACTRKKSGGSCPSLGAPLGLPSGSWGWGLEFEIDICLFCKNYGWEAELYFKNIKWVKFY